MATIRKKVWKEFFEKIISGQKKVELRLADFEVKEGDTLVMEEWDKDAKKYTGRSVEVIATYILKTNNQTFWQKEDVEKYGFQIFQFELKGSQESKRPKVGIGVMILKDNKVLLGKRKNAHGAGEYAFPGGHLEYMESFENCARRETKEECGIEIENIRFQFFGNVVKYAPKHYVHIALLADWKSGDAKVLEPNKLESWGWYGLDALPEPLFEFCKLSFESYKTGKNYFDIKDL